MFRQWLTFESPQAITQRTQSAEFRFDLRKVALDELATERTWRPIPRYVDELRDLAEAEAKFLGLDNEAQQHDRLWPV